MNAVKKKIHIQFISIAILAVTATLFLCVGAFYELFQKQVLDDLRTYADLLRGVSMGEPEKWDEYVSVINKDNLRVTLISAEGTVEYDSAADYASMENHRERPEVTGRFKPVPDMRFGNR